MFDFLKKTHKITYASVSFDGTRHVSTGYFHGPTGVTYMM